MMTLDEAIKHAEEVMVENLEKTKGRNASDPIAINCFECAEEHRQLAEWLKELKQLRKQTRWIPVSKRLPEDFQRVLVTIVNYKGDKIVRVAEYHEGVFQIKENFEKWKVGEKGLLAWMPLPEPYKKEESEDIKNA